MPRPKTTSFWRNKERKIYLTVLNDADGQWVDFAKIASAVKYAENTLTATTTSFLRMGLIETRRNHVWDGLVSVLQVRITPRGRSALMLDKFTYRELLKTISVPTDVYDALVNIAQELNIYREAGEGTGSMGGITQLMREIVVRQDVFKKWYKHLTAEKV